MRKRMNKKGLSTVVTTLIMILLVLVAIGVVWAVVNNLLQTGADQFDTNSQCLLVNVEATSVVCSDPTACSVTLKRAAGGDDIGGVKMAFTDGTNTNVVTVAGNIVELGATTNTVNSGFVLPVIPSEVSTTVYFIDAAGEERLCSQSRNFIIN